MIQSANSSVFTPMSPVSNPIAASSSSFAAAATPGANRLNAWYTLTGETHRFAPGCWARWNCHRSMPRLPIRATRSSDTSGRGPASRTHSSGTDSSIVTTSKPLVPGCAAGLDSGPVDPQPLKTRASAATVVIAAPLLPWCMAPSPCLFLGFTLPPSRSQA